MFPRAKYFLPLALAAIVGMAPPPAMALDASELALVVNRRMPDGLKLAELYAAQRQVPDHRIIELDLPTSEEMPFDVYEREVVPPIREFLRLNDPQRHIKCLVTFYGVPFRISTHLNTQEETLELNNLHTQLKEVGGKLNALVNESEKMAASMDPSFTSAVPTTSLVPVEPGNDLNGAQVDALARRIEHAGKSMMVAIAKIGDPVQHQAAATRLLGLVQRFNAPVQIDNPPTTAALPPNTPVDPLVAAMPLEDRRFDPVAREQVRQEAANTAGAFNYAKLLLAQIGYLSPQDTEAATDSELSLLWWTYYSRPRWQLNSLCYHFANAGPIPSLMVARLDAPTPETVRQMILDSVHTEAQGLQGRVVIDAQGLSLIGTDGKPDSFAFYDESLRQVAELVRQKTSLPLTLDNKPAVLPPHSVQDVALYCGWYSVGKYVPACSFVPGAVGYHMASYEMVSLRDPGNTGWVRGLLNDGIAATLGPVSEPYLQAFPQPDEFFPLLLTGKLTLAEVYWKTELLASWRMCLVGDPLYTPFKLHPALKIEDLPPRLKPIFAPPPGAALGPASGPAVGG